nr:hypothetical protein [Tanacetum cinerariifolium]
FFIIAVQTLGSGISILLAVGTPSTGSRNLYCQWELSPGMQTPGSGISILLAVGTPSTGSGNLYCQWELSPGRKEEEGSRNRGSLICSSTSSGDNLQILLRESGVDEPELDNPGLDKPMLDKLEAGLDHD